MYKQFSLLLRQSLIISNQLRGPKKAKAEVSVQSDDLINIWKERKDPEIKDIEEYPLWLLELSIPLEPAIVHVPAFAYGDKTFYPPASHMRSILRSISREKIISYNQYNQMVKKGGLPPENDDLESDLNALEHIQQEKMAAEQAAEEAAEAAEDDDEDAPKAKKPVIQKEVDEDEKPKAASPTQGKKK